LGVYVDQHLNWNTQGNTHIAHVVEKGSKWSSQLRREVAPSWGLTPKYARRMFVSMAIPKILYAGINLWNLWSRTGKVRTERSLNQLPPKEQE